jgi:2-ketoarginine methyltransferase
LTSIEGSDRGSLLPARLPGVDAGFEQRLIEGIRPIAQLFLASALHHLFSSGIYDWLARHDNDVSTGELAAGLDLEPERLTGFLLYLANEDIVTVQAGQVALTARARKFSEFRAWYTLMIGGYTTTADQIGDALHRGASACTRNGRHVGTGSCDLAHYDGMPMLQTLIDDAGIQPNCILDLGCGDGLYLVEMCRRMEDVDAWGAEPDSEAFIQAQAVVEAEGLGSRIHLVNSSAEDFLANPPDGCNPDLLFFGYVLQEILGQKGRQTVVDLLRSVAAAFPQIKIVVIEVANEITSPTVMRHGLARNFWNVYYLVHYFTNQKLETRDFWENLFEEAGLVEMGAVTTPSSVDTTGLELGYLLRPASAST